jgi:PBSX family phage terminase large subunit
MSGSVRSGKTFSQHLIINDFLASPECIPNEDIILSGKAGDTLERNMVKDIMKMATMFGRGKDFEYYRQPRRIHYKPKKIDLWVIGANDDGAEERVRGMTAQAMFADEVTAQNRACFLQQIARTSAGKRLKVCTTNPDSPSHWAKTTFIDPGTYGEINGGFNYFEFDITQDNPVLDKSYIKNLEMVYTGVDKERFLHGKWVADTESLILPEFQEHEEHIVKKKDMPSHCKKIVSMDLGMVDDTSIVFGYYDFSNNKKVVQDSIFLKHPSTQDIANAIKEKEKDLWGNEKPYGRYSDTNLHVIHDLNVLHDIHFLPTRKDDKLAQINAFRVSLKNREYEIHPRNKKLIGQLRIGTWNKTKKSYERTDEEGHFDGIDSCIYFNRNIEAVTSLNPFPYGAGIKKSTHHITETFYMEKPLSEKEKIAKAFLGDNYALNQR